MTVKASKTKKESKFKGFNNILAVRLRQLMKGKGTTQQELAEKTGCSRQAIAQYMDGSNAPNIDKLILIAEFFNVSIDYLVGKDKKQTEEELVQNIVNYTSLSNASIEELKTERLIAENNSKDYANYLNIINSFIQSGMLLEITLYVTKLKDFVNKKNSLNYIDLKSIKDLDGYFKNLEHQSINVMTEKLKIIRDLERKIDIQREIDLCLFHLQELISSFARNYCSQHI